MAEFLGRVGQLELLVPHIGSLETRFVECKASTDQQAEMFVVLVPLLKAANFQYSIVAKFSAKNHNS